MQFSLPHRFWSHIGFLLTLTGLAVLFFNFSQSVEIAKAQDCLPVPTCTITTTDPLASVGLDISVSGFVPETALELKGYAAPGAFVLASDSGNIIGATTALADGSFDFMIHALQGGSTHAISVYAANSNQVTPGTGFVVTVVQNTVTTVDDIILPTFIDVDPTTQNSGQPIHVKGDAVPGASVTVHKQSPLESVTVIADLTGHWDVELVTEFGVLPDGIYTANADIIYSSLIAPTSRSVQFEIKPVPSTTKLVINGYGPPGAFLSFVDGASVVGNGIVATNGTFSQTIVYPDVNAPVDLKITANAGSELSPETAIATSVTAFTTTTIDDVLLPTFIDVTPITTNEGSPITVEGLGAPGATVTLTIVSPTLTTTRVIDVNGDWSIELLSEFGPFAEGTYTAQAKLTMAGGLESVDSRQVTFTVQETQTATSLQVDGFAAPGTFLTFTENNAVVGTAVASGTGTFSQTLQFPDVTLTRTVNIVGDDGTQQTPATTFTVSLTALSQTTVSNLVIPTFINVTPLKVPYGTTVQALGTTVPTVGGQTSMVRLFMQSPLVSADLIPGADGKWNSDLNALFGQLEKGNYTAYARVYVNGSYQSNLSREINFEVVESDACADRRSDLNCDGKVDITDVGILIYYWGAAGAGQKADISKDGVVDVADVGIMVYDWTY